MKQLTLLFLLALMPIVASADDSGKCGDNLTWTYSSDSQTLTISGTGEMYINNNLSVPWYIYRESITIVVIENDVTSIANFAFCRCTSLTSIEIPSSVTSIGENAFSECTSLKSIKIPSSVTSIGNSAFQSCIGLTSINIPSSVTSIADGAFAGCKGLTSINIPSSVTSIGKNAFMHCTGLTKVEINCKEVGSWFSSNTTMKEVILGDGVTSIGASAFTLCRGLTSINIPSSVTSIGEDAFFYCTGLTSINIPSRVTSIGENAFLNCTGLNKAEFASIEKLCSIKFNNSTSNPLSYAKHLYIDGMEVTDVTIPSSVTSIGDYAFYGCEGLTSIDIPSSVTSIGDYAFYGWTGLTPITIPSSVSSIGKNALFSQKKELSIYISSIEDWLNICFDYDPQDNLGDLVTQCNYHLYIDNIEVTSINIPHDITSIGNYAFYCCNYITSIKIPNSVTSIGDYAFCGCKNLTSIEISNNINSIGSYAFKNSNIKSLIISDSSASILRKEFSDLKRLSIITLLSSKPPFISDFGLSTGSSDKFTDTPFDPDVFEYAYVHIPKGSYEAYSSAYGWRYFKRFKEDLDINGNTYYVNLRVQESEKGYVEQAVKVDESYTVKFGKKKGARVKKVMFNGEDVTPDVINNTFTTPVIKQDSEIIILYDEVDGDINGDGNIDTQDVFEIYQYMQQH